MAAFSGAESAHGEPPSDIVPPGLAPDHPAGEDGSAHDPGDDGVPGLLPRTSTPRRPRAAQRSAWRRNAGRLSTFS